MLSKPSKYYMFPVLATKDYLLLVLLAWFIVFKGAWSMLRTNTTNTTKILFMWHAYFGIVTF